MISRSQMMRQFSMPALAPSFSRVLNSSSIVGLINNTLVQAGDALESKGKQKTNNLSNTMKSNFAPLGITRSLCTSSATNTVASDELKFLNKEAVRKIREELQAADANKDGRIDADDLKSLLNAHSDVFNEEDIMTLSDMFYSIENGGSASFDEFIAAIDASFDEHNEDFLINRGRGASEFIYAGKSHSNYTKEQLDIKQTHVEPKNFRDRLALRSVGVIRYCFDTATGWNGEITKNKTLLRCIYLETIAAVPGMVAAIHRHFSSLRNMKRDGGLLQMFLDEANNERMHLLTFISLKDPGLFFRVLVLGGQVGFTSVFSLAYLISPKFCHRMVGYIEEEAVSTYTKIVESLKNAPADSELGIWRDEPAPNLAIAYWKLGPKGTILDMFEVVRADEAEHRDVNHLVTDLKPDEINPLYDPKLKLNQMKLSIVM